MMKRNFSPRETSISKEAYYETISDIPADGNTFGRL